MLTQEESLDLWHRSVKAEGGEEAKPLLTRLFAEDITFRAPLYLTPRQGRDVVIFILETVSGIFENFTYHRELVTPESWALEFSANIGKYEIKGIDLMAVNAGRAGDRYGSLYPTAQWPDGARRGDACAYGRARYAGLHQGSGGLIASPITAQYK